MFQCHVCGSKDYKNVLIEEVFLIEHKPTLVKNIPATVCNRCGEKIFSRETTEKIRRMVHGESKPIKSISMDVFDYA